MGKAEALFPGDDRFIEALDQGLALPGPREYNTIMLIIESQEWK